MIPLITFQSAAGAVVAAAGEAACESYCRGVNQTGGVGACCVFARRDRTCCIPSERKRKGG